MKYCPQCETEYLDHATVCADCSCELVTEEELAAHKVEDGEAMIHVGGDLVRLCAVGDQVEAEGLLDMLRRERVPAHLHTFDETVYIGHTDLHQGFGEVWVPRALLHHARALADEYWCNLP